MSDDAVAVLAASGADRLVGKQMARLAAWLDGRSQVYIRMIENGLSREDLLLVARARGYSLIVHEFGKYYEFVYTPHQPGRYA